MEWAENLVTTGLVGSPGIANLLPTLPLPREPFVGAGEKMRFLSDKRLNLGLDSVQDWDQVVPDIPGFGFVALIAGVFTFGLQQFVICPDCSNVGGMSSDTSQAFRMAPGVFALSAQICFNPVNALVKQSVHHPIKEQS